jgi:GTPase SAR1 family protein
VAPGGDDSLRYSVHSGSVLGTSMIDEESKGENADFKFKMMMIGDLSAGKTDMMAKYFGKTSHEIFITLTEDAIVKENKTIECCKKNIKIDCLDTT